MLGTTRVLFSSARVMKIPSCSLSSRLPNGGQPLHTHTHTHTKGQRERAKRERERWLGGCLWGHHLPALEGLWWQNMTPAHTQHTHTHTHMCPHTHTDFTSACVPLTYSSLTAYTLSTLRATWNVDRSCDPSLLDKHTGPLPFRRTHTAHTQHTPTHTERDREGGAQNVCRDRQTERLREREGDLGRCW